MNRVKELRKLHGYSQVKLAKTLNVHQTAISQWETGRTSPDMEVAAEMAQLFGVSLEYLLGISDEPSAAPDPTWINVLGRVAAGIPIEAIEEVIDHEQITEEMARSGKYIGLKIHGSSMEPRMKEGDTVIVRLQDDCDSGDTVIAMINGDEATCKIIKKMPEGITLISTNPAYDPMFFSNREIEEKPIRILGKVVELRAKF